MFTDMSTLYSIPLKLDFTFCTDMCIRYSLDTCTDKQLLRVHFVLDLNSVSTTFYISYRSTVHVIQYSGMYGIACPSIKYDFVNVQGVIV